MQAEAVSGQPELPPDTVAFIKQIAATSAFQPDATPDMVVSVTQIQPHRYEYGALDCYLATTTSGLDLVITEMPRDRYWEADDPAFDETTEWKTPATVYYSNDGSTSKESFGNGYYLEGLLEQKFRTLDLEEGRFKVKLMTGPDRFNHIMTALGKQPGVDSLKLTPIAGGEFSARSLVEATSRLEIPAAMGEALFAEHDRALDDHIQAWWSMPPELVVRLQQGATEVLATNDDETIANFADGLDLLSSLSKLIVPEASRLLDSEWAESETVDDRLRQLEDFVSTLASHIGSNGSTELGQKYSVNARYHANKACVALIETGLLPGIPLTESDTYGFKEAVFPPKITQDPPELLKARETVSYWGMAYARSAIDMLARASDIQHLPANARRSEFMHRATTQAESNKLAA